MNRHHDHPILLVARLAGLLIVLSAAGAVVQASDSGPYATTIRPYLTETCFKCHGEKKQKGDLRLDTLPLDFVDSASAQHWSDVLDRITGGDMPPEKEPRPNPQASAAVVDWISTKLAEADSARHASAERVSFYKLTREEYANTIRDLLGVTYEATGTTGMSEDPDWLGFERIGSVLSLAPAHIEKYLTAADAALNEALAMGPQPKHEHIHWDPFDLRPGWSGLKKDFIERGGLDQVRVPIVPNSNAFGWENSGTKLIVPTTGEYQVTLKVSGMHPGNARPPRLQFYASDLDRMLFQCDVEAPEDKPLTITFRTHLAAGTHDIRINNAVPGPSATSWPSRESSTQAFTGLRSRAPWQMKLTDDAGNALRRFLILDFVEWEGPLLESWPTPAHRRIIGTGGQDAHQIHDIVARFAARAFRRPVADAEVEPYAELAQAEMKAGKLFVPAVKSALMAILCASDFVYLVEGTPEHQTTTLNDYELASRLSYFLWSTMPDDRLIELAHAGTLHQRTVLHDEVHRMLADQRSAAFADSFPRQWLQLRRVGMFAPDRALYPDYDEYLQASMINECTSFFAEVLAKNLSVREFLDSDWTMLNACLAELYGIAGVRGEAMQRIQLAPSDHRGGLLTQAALLSLTSDGTRHRPVHRGKWLAESILGKAVPPPPANVPSIKTAPPSQPKTSLRDKLAAHLEDPTCAACHRKIDPLGFAFENYDAIGRWRTVEAVRDGSGANPVINASGVLADGRAFSDCPSFKRLLLDDADHFAAALTEKLATYALRRVMGFSDRADLQRIVAESKDDQYRLATLVESVVTSDLFQKR